MSALLTVRAAADRLGVSYSTLKQWIYDGAVRTVRTKGGHHRLTELEVQRLLLSDRRRRHRAVDEAPPAETRPERRPRHAPGSSRQVRRAGPLSGRNQLRGIVEEVRGDGLLAQVRLRIGDQRLTAMITQDAVAELKLKRGDEAVAIITEHGSDDRPLPLREAAVDRRATAGGGRWRWPGSRRPSRTTKICSLSSSAMPASDRSPPTVTPGADGLGVAARAAR